MIRSNRCELGLRYNIKTKNHDYYETPAIAVEKLLSNEIFLGKILEPCCGSGSISKILIQQGYKVISSDIYDFGYGKVKDMFSYKCVKDNVITNPPFNLIEEFILHFLPLVKYKFAVLCRINFIQSQKRFDTIFKNTPPSRIKVFVNRINFLPNYAVKSGMLVTGWFIWDKTINSRETILSWLK